MQSFLWRWIERERERERENERELGGKRGSDSCGDCFGTLGIPLVLSM
jgi:hypothetical protein